MKKIITIFLILFIGFFSSDALAVKKVPKKGKKDSTKAQSSVKTDKKLPEKKQPPVEVKTPPLPPPPSPRQKSAPAKDNFIDRDGDGINDNIRKSKPPEVKKERLPKIVKRKAKEQTPKAKSKKDKEKRSKK